MRDGCGGEFLFLGQACLTVCEPQYGLLHVHGPAVVPVALEGADSLFCGDAGHVPRLRPASVLWHVCEVDAARVQLLDQVGDDCVELCRRVHLGWDQDAVFPQAALGLVAVGRVRKEAAADAFECRDGLVEGRCAVRDLACFWVERAVAVEHCHVGLAQVFV